MHRFYIPDSDFSSHQVTLKDKNEIHHLKNVLRLKKNDSVQIFNGKGQEALGEILSLHSNQVLIQIQSVQIVEPKVPSLILACAVPKKGKFEFIIEKTTELGVDEIIPLKTQRSEIKIEGSQINKKSKRFQIIALNAVKQCQRATIPLISPPTHFSDAILRLTKISTIIIPSLVGRPKSLFNVLQSLPPVQKISFFIGPEGDFTQEEYAQAKEAGCIPANLGDNILKVETAALCTIALAHLFYHHESY